MVLSPVVTLYYLSRQDYLQLIIQGRAVGSLGGEQYEAVVRLLSFDPLLKKMEIRIEATRQVFRAYYNLRLPVNSLMYVRFLFDDYLPRFPLSLIEARLLTDQEKMIRRELYGNSPLLKYWKLPNDCWAKEGF